MGKGRVQINVRNRQTLRTAGSIIEHKALLSVVDHLILKLGTTRSVKLAYSSILSLEIIVNTEPVYDPNFQPALGSFFA